MYDPEALYEEVAFVAYHFGWSHDDVLALPHWERQRWCAEISQINDRMNDDQSPSHQRGSDSGGVVLRNSLDSM